MSEVTRITHDDLMDTDRIAGPEAVFCVVCDDSKPARDYRLISGRVSIVYSHDFSEAKKVLSGYAVSDSTGQLIRYVQMSDFETFTSCLPQRIRVRIEFAHDTGDAAGTLEFGSHGTARGYVNREIYYAANADTIARRGN